MDLVSIIVNIAISLISAGTITAIITTVANRHKTQAETQTISADAKLKAAQADKVASEINAQLYDEIREHLITPLECRVKALEDELKEKDSLIEQQAKRIHALEQENNELYHGIRKLIQALLEANIEVPWQPRDREYYERFM